MKRSQHFGDLYIFLLYLLPQTSASSTFPSFQITKEAEKASFFYSVSIRQQQTQKTYAKVINPSILPSQRDTCTPSACPATSSAPSRLSSAATKYTPRQLRPPPIVQQDRSPFPAPYAICTGNGTFHSPLLQQWSQSAFCFQVCRAAAFVYSVAASEMFRSCTLDCRCPLSGSYSVRASGVVSVVLFSQIYLHYITYFVIERQYWAA